MATATVLSSGFTLGACQDTMPSYDVDPLPTEKEPDRWTLIEGATLPVEAFGDNLVATDGLGRTLPGYEECGDRYGNRYVGLFYWLWHSNLRRDRDKGNYDVTKVLEKDPGSQTGSLPTIIGVNRSLAIIVQMMNMCFRSISIFSRS